MSDKYRKDSLGNRMKQYEYISRIYLPRHIPVIIRLDGKAFHTFTRGFEKPFDPIFMYVMQETTRHLCENIQGCVFGYTQSDEITLVLTDYNTINTDAWFGYNIQKMSSVSASLATFYFNKIFNEFLVKSQMGGWDSDRFKQYKKALENSACFDSRVFSIPKEEVINCLIWRQDDCIRNSILSVGQFYFSNKDLLNKSCKDICSMLISIGQDWNVYTSNQKYGTACVKVETTKYNDKGESFIRKSWNLDRFTPVFKENRSYIEDLV